MSGVAIALKGKPFVANDVAEMMDRMLAVIRDGGTSRWPAIRDLYLGGGYIGRGYVGDNGAIVIVDDKGGSR